MDLFLVQSSFKKSFMFEKIQLQFEYNIIVWQQTCTLLVFCNQTRHKNVYKYFEQKISRQN